MTSVLSPLIEKIFYGGAFTAYSVGMSLFLGYALTRREQLALVGKWTLEGAVGMHVVSLLIRTFIGRQMPQHDWYVPWSNWFESFSFFAAVIATEYLIIQRGRTVPILGAFVTPLVFLVMLVAIHSPFGMQIPMLVPALQSHWMAFHVPVMFIAMRPSP